MKGKIVFLVNIICCCLLLNPTVFAYDYVDSNNKGSVESARRDIYSLKALYVELAGEEEEEVEISYSGTCSDSYLWPIGSKKTTTSDGKEFALDEPETTTITSTFGSTGDVSSHSNGHGAIDIGGGTKGETNIIAAKDGVVLYPAENNQINCPDGSLGNTCGGGYGNYVIIEHSDGNFTLYGHMYANSITVKAGDTVKAGQVIGKMGTSGDSSGTHLHFEFRLGENNRNAKVDPLKYVDSANPRPSSASCSGISIANEIITQYEGIGCSGQKSEEGDNYIACNGGDSATTIGPGVTLEYNSERFAKRGYTNLSVGSRVPKSVVDDIKNEILEEKNDYISKKLAEAGIDGLKDYQMAVLISRYYNAPTTLSGDYGFIQFYKKYNGKYSYDDINSNSSSLWYDSMCHPWQAAGFQLGLQRRRLSEWKLFTTGEIDYFDGYTPEHYYCSP